jgi:hypothetical protein
MTMTLSSELPPVDFVAFLAQRSGLSQEAAEDRLERWFGEYHAEHRPSAGTQTEAGTPQSLAG